MNAKCSICFEVLSEYIPPVATRCGHMYCIDCATFNFGRTDARCAVCRKPHLLEDLVKLYTDYEKQEVSYEVDQQPKSSTCREQALNAGHCAMKDADTWAVRTLADVAMDRANVVPARDIPDPECPNIVDMQKTLTSVRRTLQAVYHSMEQMTAERITRLEAEVRRREKENTRLGEHAKELARQRRRARKVATTRLDRGRADFQAKESEIQAKLRRLRDDLIATKDELRQCDERRTQANEEMKLWRGSATKNKKKYYALKARRSVTKKDHDSDESLEIV